MHGTVVKIIEFTLLQALFGHS